MVSHVHGQSGRSAQSGETRRRHGAWRVRAPPQNNVMASGQKTRFSRSKSSNYVRDPSHCCGIWNSGTVCGRFGGLGPRNRRIMFTTLTLLRNRYQCDGLRTRFPGLLRRGFCLSSPFLEILPRLSSSLSPLQPWSVSLVRGVPVRGTVEKESAHSQRPSLQQAVSLVAGVPVRGTVGECCVGIAGFWSQRSVSLVGVLPVRGTVGEGWACFQRFSR